MLLDVVQRLLAISANKAALDAKSIVCQVLAARVPNPLAEAAPLPFLAVPMGKGDEVCQCVNMCTRL